MAISPVSVPSIYAPVERVRFDRTPEVGAVERGVADPRPVAPVDRTPVDGSPGLESLTSSARAATVALATIPRDAEPAELRTATNAAENAALGALADPTVSQSPRQVAENFAAVAALVPTPQQLARAPAEDGTDFDTNRSAPVADDVSARGSVNEFPGTRLSRFA